MSPRLTIYVLSIIFLFFAGCSIPEENGEYGQQVFWKDFENRSEIAEIISVDTLSSGAWISPTKAILTDDNHIIFADNGTQSLLKYSLNGELIARTGGRGRGPGEFELLNDLKVVGDKQLYALDLGLGRVSIFNVQDSLTYQRSINMEKSTDLFLKEIFFTEIGKIGVYIGTVDRRTGEKRHFVYRLNDSFSPDSLLFEFDGNEQIEFQQGIYIDKLLGEMMYWDQAGEYFYVVSSHDWRIQRFHLRSRQLDEWNLLESGLREATEQDKAFLFDRFSPLIAVSEEYRKVITEASTLPVIRGFSIEGNRLLFTLFNTNHSESVLLTADLELQNKLTIRKLPPFFSTLFSKNNQLFGFDYAEEGHRPLLVLSVINTQ